MANLIVGTNSKVAAVSLPIAGLGLTADNCLLIYEAFGVYKSWKPGREINAIKDLVQGRGYVVIMKKELDLPAYFISPIPETGNGTRDNSFKYVTGSNGQIKV